MHLCRTSAHLLQALLRDGYKYAISGLYDRQSCLGIDEIDLAASSLDNTPMAGSAHTEVVHIFSESAENGDKVGLSF
jgi:hypothetical protein